MYATNTSKIIFLKKTHENIIAVNEKVEEKNNFYKFGSACLVFAKQFFINKFRTNINFILTTIAPHKISYLQF